MSYINGPKSLNCIIHQRVYIVHFNAISRQGEIISMFERNAQSEGKWARHVRLPVNTFHFRKTVKGFQLNFALGSILKIVKEVRIRPYISYNLHGT